MKRWWVVDSRTAPQICLSHRHVLKVVSTLGHSPSDHTIRPQIGNKTCRCDDNSILLEMRQFDAQMQNNWDLSIICPRQLQNYRITELNGFLEAPGGLYTTCDNTPLLNITQFVPLIRDTMIGGLIFDQTCKLQYEHMYNLMLTIFLLVYGYSRGKVLFNFCTYLQFL